MFHLPKRSHPFSAGLCLSAVPLRPGVPFLRRAPAKHSLSLGDLRPPVNRGAPCRISARPKDPPGARPPRRGRPGPPASRSLRHPPRLCGFCRTAPHRARGCGRHIQGPDRPPRQQRLSVRVIFSRRPVIFPLIAAKMGELWASGHLRGGRAHGMITKGL